MTSSFVILGFDTVWRTTILSIAREDYFGSPEGRGTVTSANVGAVTFVVAVVHWHSKTCLALSIRQTDRGSKRTIIF